MAVYAALPSVGYCNSEYHRPQQTVKRGTHMKKTKFFLDILIITLGAGVYALGVTALLRPHNIVPGGVTGLSILLCDLFPILPLGLTILTFNVPLFILAWKFLGHRFLWLTAYGTAISSVLVDLAGRWVPPMDTEPLLAGIFGGLLNGFGLGLVFTRGATTGGSDIVVRLLKRFFPNTQLGKLILGFDGFVVAFSGLVFRSVNSMLFAALSLYIGTRALDAILYGLKIERVAYIVSEKAGEVAKAIGTEMQRGATLLHGEGAFSGQGKKIILCAVKRQQLAHLKTLIQERDPGAFLIVSEANEVFGQGFSRSVVDV